MITKYSFPTDGPPNKSPDNNVNQICDEFVKRSQHGFTKYGVTTERTDLEFDQWLQHLKEEMMDAVVYLHRIQKERALDKMEQNAEQLGLYNNMSTTVGGDTIINTMDYCAGMPAALEITDISLLGSGDTITISLDNTSESKNRP